MTQVDKEEIKKIAKLRAYNPEQDKAFIFASWLKGLYYGDTAFKEIPKAIFMENYHRVIEHIINRNETDITIMCLKDEPDTILGYTVIRTLNSPDLLNIKVLD